MHVELFRALTSANVTDDKAEQVVAELEDFIVRKVEDANRELIAKIDGLIAAQTKIIDNNARTASIMGTVLAIGSLLIAGATIGAKFIH